jgi:hypothetical protein
MSTHTAAKMAVAIGQTVNVRVESWIIPMKVIDAKSAWGNIRVEVEPLSGEGRAWIELSRIVIPSDSRQLVNCHA